MKNLLAIIITIHISHIFCMQTDFMHKPYPLAIMYAPWREDYCNAQQKPEFKVTKPCTFCSIIKNKNDTENFILHRGKYSLIMLASQPYIDKGIHLLIVPYEHKRELCDLSSETYYEENILTHKLCTLFSSSAHETYINSNQGSSAGASIPDHHHKHIMINYASNIYNLIEALQESKKYIDLPSIYKYIQPQIYQLENVIVPQKPLSCLNRNCYYCSILWQNFQKNLIIHRGKNATIMLSHYPSYFGEIDIIPNEHITSLENMPLETYEEINKATLDIYPIILKLIHAQDSNIGLVSYGNKTMDKEHIRQKLIPRKDSWKKSPITNSNHINGDIKQLYKKLVSEWCAVLNKDYLQRSAKL